MRAVLSLFSCPLDASCSGRPSTTNPHDIVPESGSFTDKTLVAVLWRWCHVTTKHLSSDPLTRVEKLMTVYRDSICGLCNASHRGRASLERIVCVYAGLCSKLGSSMGSIHKVQLQGCTKMILSFASMNFSLCLPLHIIFINLCIFITSSSS